MEMPSGDPPAADLDNACVLRCDIRKLQEPIEQLSLKEKNSETLLGGVCLEYDPIAGLTKFMIGTE